MGKSGSKKIEEEEDEEEMIIPGSPRHKPFPMNPKAYPYLEQKGKFASLIVGGCCPPAPPKT
jgi:hypothetical protein